MKNYVSAKDISKLIREDLKQHFPSIKFSVRSGNSIRVSYNSDSVRQQEVRNVICKYEGSGFDGMQDLKYSKGAFKIEDGIEFVSLVDFVFVDNENYEFEKSLRFQPVSVS
jgi:hypothetical protein